MRQILLIPACLVAVSLAATSAYAQETETDRLREALRQATLQARSAEDQRNALQVKLTKAEGEKTALKGELDKAKAKIRELKQDYKQAVTDFNTRLEERNQQLDKWKEAYTEAVTVARSKDAERAKFEAEANAYKASTQSCAEKNKELAKLSQELLADYKGVTLGDALLAQEPVTGIGRVGVQQKLEGYDERLQGQTFK